MDLAALTVFSQKLLFFDGFGIVRLKMVKNGEKADTVDRFLDILPVQKSPFRRFLGFPVKIAETATLAREKINNFAHSRAKTCQREAILRSAPRGYTYFYFNDPYPRRDWIIGVITGWQRKKLWPRVAIFSEKVVR